MSAAKSSPDGLVKTACGPAILGNLSAQRSNVTKLALGPEKPQKQELDFLSINLPIKSDQMSFHVNRLWLWFDGWAETDIDDGRS